MPQRTARGQCKACPFRSTSLRGWLGAYEAEGIFPNVLWRGEPFLCHSKIDYEDECWQEQAEKNGELCIGSLLAAEDAVCPPSEFNAVRAARAAALLIRKANPAKFDVMNPTQFLKHHRPFREA